MSDTDAGRDGADADVDEDDSDPQEHPPHDEPLREVLAIRR
ncbi:hypothetical protein RYH80_18755 [Halobaculum sp. MBLA0147]